MNFPEILKKILSKKQSAVTVKYIKGLNPPNALMKILNKKKQAAVTVKWLVEIIKKVM